VLGFAYDQKRTDLATNAQRLEFELLGLRREGVSRLSITAYSMGGWVAKAALDRMTADGTIAEFESVQLVALATPWGGFERANIAWHLRFFPTPGLARTLSRLMERPMGFRGRLGHAVHPRPPAPLPAHVAFYVCEGGADEVATPHTRAGAGELRRGGGPGPAAHPHSGRDPPRHVGAAPPGPRPRPHGPERVDPALGSGSRHSALVAGAKSAIIMAPKPSTMARATPVLDDHFKDHCGLFGIHGHPEAARLTYLGLYALQHRGQESAGIVASDGVKLRLEKAMGLVNDVFTDERLEALVGDKAMGHVRYSTAGTPSPPTRSPS
jgi:hypothetical protein